MKRFYCKADNTAANNIEYRVLEAESTAAAEQTFNEYLKEVQKKHCLVTYANIEIHEITEELKAFKYVKKNGSVVSNKFSNIIQQVEEKAAELFGNEILMIRHFYYGDRLDMATIVLKDKNYGNIDIYECGVVSFNGHSATEEQLKKFKKLIVK